MKQPITNIICSTIVGISIIAGSLIIRDHREDSTTKESQELVQATYKPLMTIEETAEYLNLSEVQIIEIISTEASALEATGSYSGKMFPIIKFENEIYVSTDGLNEWLKEASTQRKQY